MGFWSDLLGWLGFGRKKSTAYGFKTSSAPWNGSVWEHDISRGIIDAIASAAAQGSFLHVRVDEKGKIAEIFHNSAYAKVLNLRPNPVMTASQLWYRMFAQLEVQTTAIAWVKWTTAGDRVVPEAIIPVDHRHYSFQRVEDTGELAIEIYPDDGGQSFYLLAEDCIVLRKFYLRHLGGGDGNQPLEEALKMSKASDEGFVESLEVANKVRGVHKHKMARLHDDDVKKDQEAFANRFKAAAESGGFLSIDVSEDYNPFNVNSYSATAAQMNIISERFYSYFRTPKEIVLGTASDSVRQSWQVSRIQPMWRELEEVLNVILFTQRERDVGNRIMVMGGGIQNASFETRLNYIDKTFGKGFVADNDYRELLGLPPTEDGNRYTLNLMYIDKANAAEYQLGHKEDETDEQSE